ncbi:5'-nucleotidase C-terminal domain-containing protein [Paenibacillus sp. WLX1005]|uniref:5'-nucleotidase C-terminal domain-containing protein n=1 Tax=Paenibacillus sp. WLX1005 TaxID=3243766 RepID=UPI0039845480
MDSTTKWSCGKQMQGSQKMSRVWIHIALCFSLVITSTSIPSTAQAADVQIPHENAIVQQGNNSFPLTIIHTNDTHSSLDNVARRVTAVNQARQQAEKENVPSILVDSGDVMTGTMYFIKYLGQAELDFMNRMKYDAMTFGNHEFDRGPEVLANFIKGAQFPFVASNVDFSNDDLLSPFQVNDTTLTPKQIHPYLIKEINGEPIGIFGLTTEDTKLTSSPGKVMISEPIARAKAVTAELRQQGVNKVIVLSHLGYGLDLELARQVPDIDIIAGGHSHTLLKTPTVIAHDGGNPTIIVQTEDKSVHVGNLKVEFDATGKLIQWQENLIEVSKQPEDAATKTVLEQYKKGIAEEYNTVIGKSEVDLLGAVSGWGVPRLVRKEETAIGNLVVDAMLDKAKEVQTGALMAIQNGGGVRINFFKGNLTTGLAQEMLPFSNDLVVLEMSGQEIWDTLEIGVSRRPGEFGGFPNVAGMKFTYDSNRPSGQRLLSVSVQIGPNRYVPLNTQANYRIATNVYMAKGGDGHTVLQNAYEQGRIVELWNEQHPYEPDFQVLVDYLRKLGTLTTQNTGTTGRITDLVGKTPIVDSELPQWSSSAKGIATDVRQDRATLHWTAAEDNAAIVSYRIYQGDRQIAQWDASHYKLNNYEPYYEYTVTGLTPATEYTFTVEAVDSARRVTAHALTVQFHTVDPSDQSPPTWPASARLEATHISKTEAQLSWPAATDNIGISEYRIYDGHEQIARVQDDTYTKSTLHVPDGTVTASTYTNDNVTVRQNVYYNYTIRDLLPDHAYTFSVEAMDRSGLVTEDRLIVSVRTQSDDHSSGGHGGNGSSGNTGGGTVVVPDPPPTPPVNIPTPQPPVAIRGGSQWDIPRADIVMKPAPDGASNVGILKLDGDTLRQAVELADQGKAWIKLPDVDAKSIQIRMPATAWAQYQGIIAIQNKGLTYELPASVVSPDTLAAQWNLNPQHIELTVTMGHTDDSLTSTLQTIVADHHATLIADPMQFSVTVEADGQVYEMNDFGKTYVTRTLVLDRILDPASLTAARLNASTGQMTFVPAVFSTANGATTAIIQSSSNSIYGVIQTTTVPWSDLIGHWSEQDVQLLHAKWIINGQSSKLFAPNASITRAEFAAMLVRSLGLELTAKSSITFKDMNGSEWYASTLSTALEKGLIQGFEDHTMRAQSFITRAQMAVMVQRAAQLTGQQPVAISTPVPYQDASNLPTWASDAIQMTTTVGWMHGTPEGNVHASSAATRAEAAVMISRMLKSLGFINS